MLFSVMLISSIFLHTCSFCILNVVLSSDLPGRFLIESSICSWHLVLSMPTGEPLETPYSLKACEEISLDEVVKMVLMRTYFRLLWLVIHFID